MFLTLSPFTYFRSDKLQLITKVSELWGRTVNIKRSKTTRGSIIYLFISYIFFLFPESRPGTFVDLCNVSISFADFPEVILELKGIGSSFQYVSIILDTYIICFSAAEENAAFNFISFFENGFIAKESVKQLRSKWVCHIRSFEDNFVFMLLRLVLIWLFKKL